MAEEPHNQDRSGAPGPSSQEPKDYYSFLTKIINDVANDQALLRKLVYALAWRSLRPDAIIARPIIEGHQQATSITELAQAFELEKAIDRVEAEATVRQKQQFSSAVVRPNEASTFEIGEPGLPVDSTEFENIISSSSSDQPPVEPAPPNDQLVQPVIAVPKRSSQAQELDLAEMLQQIPPAEPRAKQPGVSQKAISASAATPTDHEITIPDHHAWLARKEVATLERIPAWLNPNLRVSLDAVEYLPINAAPQARFSPASFLQLVAASVLGVVLYIGISGWFYVGRSSGQAPSFSQGPAASSLAPAASIKQEVPQPTGVSHNPVTLTISSEQSNKPKLPFPLPTTYGVYLATPDQLHELQPLPIKVPDARVLASAELKIPGPPAIAGEKLGFVVFRRDLVNNAPQKVAVRVIAQVTRTTKFIDNRPAVVPIDGTWRIRNKAYEFKVAPVNGQYEMVLVQPDPGFLFPPGRYAFIFNGQGYDFTVAGANSSPEHCLEQIETVNGVMLAECPKT